MRGRSTPEWPFTQSWRYPINTVCPYISIIVPVKNEASSIELCIESLIAQVYPNECYEIIIVDNGSTDGTLQLIGKYCDYYSLKLINSDGRSISAVRNEGVSSAVGIIFAFIDGDCIADPMWLSYGIDILKSHAKGASVGFAAAIPTVKDSWVEQTWYFLSSSRNAYSTKEVDWLSSFNILILRRVFEEVGGFNEILLTCEDVDLGLKIKNLNYTQYMSDNIYIQHLGESKTILEFFNREVWRGKSEIEHYHSSKKAARDTLSVIIPLFYFINLMLFISSLFIALYKSNAFICFILLLSFTIVLVNPIMFVCHKNSNAVNFRNIFSLTALASVYLLARGYAILMTGMKK